MYSEIKLSAEILPDELEFDTWTCDAFPQTTFLARIWVCIFMGAILLPVQTFYIMGFQFVGNARFAGGPPFLVTRPESMRNDKLMTASNRSYLQVRRKLMPSRTLRCNVWRPTNSCIVPWPRQSTGLFANCSLKERWLWILMVGSKEFHFFKFSHDLSIGSI